MRIQLWVVSRTDLWYTPTLPHLRLETQRPWSDLAMMRTTPVLVAVCSFVTVLALQLSQDEPLSVPATAWCHKAEPTFADCLAVVRQPLWRARLLVHSTADPEFGQFPQDVFERLLTGLPLMA
jgi:hypothetical protein